MRKFRELSSRHQITLLPPSVDEFVSQEDIVRYVDAVVDEFDFGAIESQFSAFGRPAYSPRVLVKILLYGKMRGLRSSRELAQACRENLRFIFLASGERPDFRTISDFRRRFHKELSGLLLQTIEIGLREEIIELRHVAIDGTRIGASAGRKSFRRPAELRAQLKELERELGDSFEKDIEVDRKEDAEFGDDDGSGDLPKEFKDKELLRSKIRAALKHSEGIKGEQPKRVSITDPESRYMRSKGTNPAYSGIAAVDESSTMVVAGYITNAVSDNAELTPMLREIKTNTNKNPEVVTADKGFRAHQGLAELEERGIEGFVKIPDETTKRFSYSDFRYDATQDVYICRNDKVLRWKSYNKEKKHDGYKCSDCGICPLKSKCMPHGGKSRTLYVSRQQDLVNVMRVRTESERGVAMAKKRGATIEPLFGYLKGAKKLRQFLVRGMDLVNSMWKIELAAVNLAKLAKHRQLAALPA